MCGSRMAWCKVNVNENLRVEQMDSGLVPGSEDSFRGESGILDWHIDVYNIFECHNPCLSMCFAKHSAKAQTCLHQGVEGGASCAGASKIDGYYVQL